MGEIEHDAASAQSATTLLDEIGEGHDLVFVRGVGDLGDELSWAGTRRLLEQHVYREIGLDELPSSSGDTVLLAGSGAWCRTNHKWMPRALAIAELRFDRVIVLPSSFDVAEDAVRRALIRTKATVFAREPKSFEAIAGLCRARAAHDCAFFFDFARYRGEGTGTLNAFRTDREATQGELLIDDDNEDISITCESLEAWLGMIAGHALVKTDRAHVMIAAALMGKSVEFAPSSYDKLESMADGYLDGFGVRRIPAPRRVPPAAGAPVTAASREGQARITAVILSRNRPELVAAAVHSVTAAAVPVTVLVVDNNSDDPTRRALSELAAADPRVELHLSDRNLGCAGGRRLATGLVKTELVLFLDDDAELMPGALEHLLADLDAHPDAAGVTALVVDPQGKVLHYGGWMAISAEIASFTLVGGGLPFDDPSLAPTGPSGWVPGTAALLRAEALREFPIDEEMAAYYEDNDWCHRVEQARPGSFRRCREALVVHHLAGHGQVLSPFTACSEKVEKLLAQARFLAVHDRLLDVDLLWLVPELRLPDGSVDTATARLLLGLIAARGSDWATMSWLNGELGPLLGRAQLVAELERERAQARVQDAALEKASAEIVLLEQRHETLLLIEAGGWWRLRSRLLPTVRVLSAACKFARSRSGARGGVR